MKDSAARHADADASTEVVGVYETLPEVDRKECVIFAGSYHTAGAIDFLGKKYGLPPARSIQNNYWL